MLVGELTPDASPPSPAGIADAMDRTCDNLIQVASALFAAGVRGSCAAPELTPAVRVDDAVRAMGDPEA